MQMIYFFLAAMLITNTVMAKTGEGKAAKKEMSITEIKQELEKEKIPEKSFYLLSDLVRTYASVKITDEMVPDAKKSADSLLESSGKFKKNWNYGNAIHHSHLVLGRLNLLSGKVDGAKKELKLAAQTPGSPQLNSFGPNMTLAKELLEKGEKTAVLEYFDDCLRFWKSEFAKPSVDEWKTDIANGKTPQFDGNLVY